uniref:Ig-like domain-containing protein n=1 Tax=Peromyscus maniculatus bairdii TaxID=230844 RepID=A0A8C8UHV7_PERMB
AMKTLTGPFVLCLWLQLNCDRGEQLEQQPSLLSVQEGDSAVINCTYTASSPSYFSWYKQEPGAGLHLVNLFSLTSGTKENGRLKSTFDSMERYSTLHIRDAQLEDSGTYLCAVQAQCSQQACSLAPNCSCVCSYSPTTGRLCRRICTAVGFPIYAVSLSSPLT